MAQDVGQAYVGIVPSLEGFSAKLKSQLAAELRGIDAPVNEAGQRAGQSFGARLKEGISSHLAGIGAMLKTGLVVGATAAAAALGGIATFGLKSAAAMEQTQIGIEALVGSGEEATAFLGELQQFAAKTPFEFAGVADSSRRILAFGQSVGIARDQVIPTLTTIGDLVSVLGGSQENIDSVVRALGQMASKGKVSQEEVLQLAEALPGFNVNAAIASAEGMSVSDTLSLITAGGVDAATGIKAILDGMAQFPGAAGAMEKQSQTLTGVFSTFKDTMSIALTNAFTPVIPAIKDSLTQLTPVLGDALNQLAPALGGVLAAVLPLLGQLVSAITPILTPILDAIAQTLPLLAPALAPLGQAFGAIVTALAPILPVIGEVAAQLLPSLAVAVQALVPIITPLVSALGPLLTEIFVPLAPIIEAVATTLGAILGPAFEIIGAIIQALAPIIGELITAVGRLLAPILTALTPIIVRVLDALTPLLPILGDLLDPVVQVVVALTPLADVIGALLLAIMPILDPILKLVTLIISFLAQKAIVPLVQLLADAITELLKPVGLLVEPLEAFAHWLGSLDWGAIATAIGHALVDAWNWIVRTGDDIQTWFRELPGKILGWLGDLGSTLWQKGRDLVTGLWNGISSLGGWIWQKIKDFIADNITGPVTSFLGIHSPSTVFAGIGENVIRGYVKGVEDSARSASMATTAALAPAVRAPAAALPAAPPVVPVRAGDALMASFFESARDVVRTRFGNDVTVALQFS